MEQLPVTTPEPIVDLDELTQRVLRIRRGELPPDAVTEDELRAAIAMQRRRFAEGATAAAAKASTKGKGKAKTSSIDFAGIFGSDTGGEGGLFE